MIDIVYVTYNSEKWIEKCIKSVVNGNYPVEEINIIVVDNASSDGTISVLTQMQEKYQQMLGSFQIIMNESNIGFGKANNVGFAVCKSEIVCCINIDTELFPDTLMALRENVEQSSDDVAVWEFRQFPYEHPKEYDPLTGETQWVSGAAFAIRKSALEASGGFDEEIFMYVEDVDLSWRLRSMGYKLIYAPNVRVNHYSYDNVEKPKMAQHVYGVINNLLMRYRFGNLKDILEGHLRFWNVIRNPEAVPGAKKNLLKEYRKHFRKIAHFYDHGKYKKNFSVRFLGFDYTQNRLGAYYENTVPYSTPLVSIVVRTCGRPCVLRETLISLRKQTYSNMEVVIVEDGPAVSEGMIRSEFSDMNIKYFSTNEKVGRSKAGNMAMSKASGKYLNFLDDDDLFYADHVETLVATLEKSDTKAAYAVGLETAVEIESREPYVYHIKDKKVVHKQKFDRVMLCHHNYIPIQCIMFEKELFTLYGGLDESVDALEDWDLWVRYSLHTDYAFVEKTTSIYRVPYDSAINKKRQKDLDDALEVMRKKHRGYYQTVDVYTLAKLYEETLR